MPPTLPILECLSSWRVTRLAQQMCWYCIPRRLVYVEVYGVAQAPSPKLVWWALVDVALWGDWIPCRCGGVESWLNYGDRAVVDQRFEEQVSNSDVVRPGSVRCNRRPHEALYRRVDNVDQCGAAHCLWTPRVLLWFETLNPGWRTFLLSPCNDIQYIYIYYYAREADIAVLAPCIQFFSPPYLSPIVYSYGHPMF